MCVLSGYIYTGLIDGRIVKIDPRADSYTLLTRMGEPPYTDCGESYCMDVIIVLHDCGSVVVCVLPNDS